VSNEGERRRAPAQMFEHTIFYRRPEAPQSLCRQTAQTAATAAVQVERLIALGYTIVDNDAAKPK